jgi:hypothetical protein
LYWLCICDAWFIFDINGAAFTAKIKRIDSEEFDVEREKLEINIGFKESIIRVE